MISSYTICVHAYMYVCIHAIYNEIFATLILTSKKDGVEDDVSCWFKGAL